MAISEEIKIRLKTEYPEHGKAWCCAEFGLTETQVRRFAWKNNLRLRQDTEFWKEFQERAAKSKIGVKRPHQSQITKRNWILGKYRSAMGVHSEKQKKNCDICKQPFSVNKNNLSLAKKRICSSECRKVYYKKFMWKEHPHPKGMLGKHHTEEVRKRMSASHAGRPMPPKQILKGMMTRRKNGTLINLRPHTTWKAGRADDLGETWFRSSWERNYARYLNYLIGKKEIASWEFEPDTFWFEKIRRGTRCYIPDFKVKTNDGSIEYHEIKGWMDDKSKTKLKRMSKYYPKVKIVLVDKEAMKSLDKYGRLFSRFWEGR